MSNAITRPFSIGQKLPERAALAKAIEKTLMRPKVWTHDEEGNCEVDEFALADSVLAFIKWHTHTWKCDCERTRVRFFQDTWYIEGDAYHRADDWVICFACDWRIKIGPTVIWPEYKAKGQTG